jgi:hypothetical protein
VHYFQQVVESGMPPPITLRIKSIQVHGLRAQNLQPQQLPSFLSFEMILGGNVVFSTKDDSTPGSPQSFPYCGEVSADSDSIIFRASELSNIDLEDDVKFKFYSDMIHPVKVYEKCLFFFWFNCSFIDATANRLVIPREQLDNGHFKHNWKDIIFPPETSVVIEFERAAYA